MAVDFGKVYELHSDMVSDRQVELFQELLQSDLRPKVFNCPKCGAERSANIIDPGAMIARRFTCAEVPTSCQSPPNFIPKAREIFFLPGSFVYAKMTGEDMLWPGIIEDCPDGTNRYMIPGPFEFSPAVSLSAGLLGHFHPSEG